MDIALSGAVPICDGTATILVETRPLVAGKRLPTWRTGGAAAELVATPSTIAARSKRTPLSRAQPVMPIERHVPAFTSSALSTQQA